MMDLQLFRIRAFAAGNASLVIVFAGLFTATFLLPFLLQRSAGYTPLEAGLLLTPIPIATALVAPFSGALSDRIGPRLPAGIGIATMAAGLFLLTQLPARLDVADLVWRLALIGVGQGLFMSPNSSAILGSVPARRLGTASATLAQMRIDGQALGIAASGAIVALRLPVHVAELSATLGEANAQAVAFGLAVRDAFVVAAVVTGLGIVTSMVRGGRSRDDERAP
jgi:MFS family permease